MKVVTTTTYRQKVKGETVEHPPGTEIEEKDALAKRFLLDGLLLRPGETPKAKAIEPPKPEGKELLDAIVGAIGQMDLKHEESLTGAGKPVVAVIEKILGYDITAAERDDGWAAFQAAGAKS